MYQRLNAFVNKNGYALTAALLNMRDTGTIKNWIKRKDIPSRWDFLVKNMLQDFGKMDVAKIKEACVKSGK